MRPEQWTIVGVVVGALLGGAAQVVAGAVAERRALRRHREDLRRAAYEAFMAASDLEASAHQRIANLGDSRQDLYDTYYAEYIEAYHRRSAALSALALDAREEIQALAVAASDLLHDWKKGETEVQFYRA